jgi:hypothetical protein
MGRVQSALIFRTMRCPDRSFDTRSLCFKSGGAHAESVPAFWIHKDECELLPARLLDKGLNLSNDRLKFRISEPYFDVANLFPKSVQPLERLFIVSQYKHM